MKTLTFTISFFWVCLMYPQVGINTTTPDPSSQLDIQATNKGMLIPRVSLSNVSASTLDGINTAATGLLIYNTNASTIGGSGVGYYYFNGTNWERLLTSFSDDGDWVSNGANIERQSGNVYIGDTNGTNNDLYISNRIYDWDNSTYYLEPASTSRTNEIQFDNGSTSDTSIRFTQQDSGIYSPNLDEIAIATNGVQRLNVGSSGIVSIGDSNANTHYNLPSSRGTANQLMQTDGSGNVSWVNSSSITDKSSIQLGTLSNISGFVNATESNLILQNMYFNFGGGTYNFITGEYTVPYTGVYNSVVNLNMNFTTSTSKEMEIVVRLYVNGFIYSQINRQDGATYISGYTQNFTYNFNNSLNAGDVVSFRIIPVWGGSTPAPYISYSNTTITINKVY